MPAEASQEGTLVPLSPEEGLKLLREMGKSYADSLARVRELAAAEQSKVDAMLAWTVGLMGAGLLSLPTALASCGIKGQAWVWLTAPWLAGILLAVLGRVLAMSHRGADGLFFARKWGDLQTVVVNPSLSPQQLADALQAIIHDRAPAIATAKRRSRRWSRALSTVFYLVQLCFAVGVAFVVRRLSLC